MKIYVISKRNMEPGDFDRVILAATTDLIKATRIIEKFRKYNPRTDIRMEILDSEDNTMLKNLWCIKFREDGIICEITDRSDCAVQYKHVERKEPFFWDDCHVFFAAADTMSEAIDIASKKSNEYLKGLNKKEK